MVSDERPQVLQDAFIRDLLALVDVELMQIRHASEMTKPCSRG